MNQHTSIATKINNRFSRIQARIAKLLVKAASKDATNILVNDIMTVTRENDFAAIAIVLPKTVMLENEPQEFAYAYLELEGMKGLEAGIYKILVDADGQGGYLSKAALLSETGDFVRAARFLNQDPLSNVAGPKSVPIKKNPVFELFSKTDDAYIFGGSLANGQGFLIALDF